MEKDSTFLQEAMLNILVKKKKISVIQISSKINKNKIKIK